MKLSWYSRQANEKITTEVNKVMRKNGKAVIDAAKASMRASSGFDKSISKKKLGKNRRKPSAPGNPPRIQTGRLYNMFVVKKTGPNRWQIKNTDQKAHLLELGTRTKDGDAKMEARPFLKPAIRKVFGINVVFADEKTRPTK